MYTVICIANDSMTRRFEDIPRHHLARFIWFLIDILGTVTLTISVQDGAPEY